MTYLDDTFGLCGNRALVTGARSGIGRASALALAAAGADIVLWGRTVDGLDDVATETAALGAVVDVVAADLTDVAETTMTIDRLLADGTIDILVNNAGIVDRTVAVDIDLDEWRRVFSVNLDSAFVLSQRCGRAMVDRGDGAIVNIASLLSFQGGLGVASYASSKHAIAGLTKALANEWAGSGVRVNAVAPGYVVTNFVESLRVDVEREPAIRARIPAGAWADPAEIADAVVFLAGRGARYVHGHVLVVDGGWMSR